MHVKIRFDVYKAEAAQFLKSPQARPLSGGRETAMPLPEFKSCGKKLMKRRHTDGLDTVDMAIQNKKGLFPPFITAACEECSLHQSD